MKNTKLCKELKEEVRASHGEKGSFVRVTVTLPPAVYQLVSTEAARRKIAKEPDPVVSAIIREALVAYLCAR
jgi:transcriptional regulator of met regulon